MEKEFSKVHTHIGRSKFAIFAVVGFLALLTYLLITVSTQLASETVTNNTRADETLPIDIPPTDQPPAMCGEACGFRDATGSWEIGCDGGTVCRFHGIGAGAVGVCEPASGGSCPEPVAQCGEVCFTQNGQNRSETGCSEGTRCEIIPIGAGAIGMCIPEDGGACPAPVRELEPIKDPRKVGDLLPQVACNDLCRTDDGVIASCGQGESCQWGGPAAGGNFYCRPTDGSACPAPNTGDDGGTMEPGVPVEPGFPIDDPVLPIDPPARNR